jgi:hypothetical protein
VNESVGGRGVLSVGGVGACALGGRGWWLSVGGVGGRDGCFSGRGGGRDVAV